VRVPRHADLAFGFVLLLAIALGGSSAAIGLPTLLGSLVPTGLMAAAEARGEYPAGMVALPLFDRGLHSRFAPQVLFPVTAHGYPAWLEARRQIAAHDFGGVTVFSPRHTIAVALVLDDMGNDAVQAARAIALPRQVTLSFLPYPDATPELARRAERAGHEVIVHVPMEAIGNEDPGPMALRASLGPVENARRLDWALARVPGFVGVNNHMGSRFTEDQAALVPIAERLADRHLFFFDSKTTPDSRVVEVAHAFGVASAGRDIFLDDVQSEQAIGTELDELEAIARHEGVAIAIGHPHAVTLDVLTRWTKDASARGVELIPLDVAIRMKTERAVSVAYNGGQ
jgi:polysaccharide deacetylase 2 family uncharacterized protein YibQ